MPIYKYLCQKCTAETKLFRPTSRADELPECRCGNHMARQISAPSLRSMETADEYRDKKTVQDVGQMSHDRAREHWRKHELPRFIEKNGIEEAIKNGWVNPDGTPKI